MRHLVIIAATLTACAPPPEVNGGVNGGVIDPTITIAFPQIDGAEVVLECLPNIDFRCGVSDPIQIDPYAEQLQLTVVVDLDHLDLIDPSTPDVVVADGQGHWHVHIDGVSITNSSTRVAEVIVKVQPAEVNLSVTLRDNQHEPLEISDTIEFTAVSSGVDCTALPEDYCPE